MKKTIILLTLASICLLYTSCKEKPDIKQSIVTYEKDIQPLNLEAAKIKQYTYSLPQKVTPELVRKRIDEVLSITKRKDVKFIPDSATDRESNYVGLKNAADPSGIFEINKKSGRLFYNAGLKSYKNDGATENLPSEDAAIKMSREIIKKLNLPVEENELNKPVVSYLEMSLKKDQAPPEVFRKMVNVRYSRTLDGLPVEGATRLNFSFGRDAELTSLLQDWHIWESTPVEKDQHFLSKEVEKKIEDRLLRTQGIKAIHVTKRTLVLYDDGAGTMEPAVYTQAIFQYIQKDATGKESSYEIPRDFFEPVLKRSTAMFPDVKDRAVKIQPKERKFQPTDSVKRKDTRDE